MSDHPGEEPGDRSAPPWPPPPGHASPYATPAGYYLARPDHPQAVLALVLGIVGLAGLVFCGLPLLVSPVAWVIGHRTLRDIRRSGGRLAGESAARAGMVMGIIGTVLLVLLAIVVVVALVWLAAVGFQVHVATPRGQSV